MKFEFACGDGQEREGGRVTTNQPRVFPEDLLHLPRRLKPWWRARQVKLAHRRTTPEGDESSAPFGWKASGLQALPAGLFFCFFGASGLPVSSGCGGIPPKCVRMQVRSTRPCSAVGRYIPLHEASCVRRAGRRSGAVGSSVTEGPMTKQHREALQVQSMHQEGEAALRRLQEHDFGLQENDCRPCF